MQSNTEDIKTSARFHPGLGYDYRLGVFYRLKKINDKLVPAHLLFPTDDDLIRYFCVVTSKNKKVRPLKAAYEIFNERAIDKDSLVYPKDLDIHNWKADNVGILPKETFKKLRDALYNVENGVSVQTHPDRPYTYVVKWKEKSKFKSKTVHDITSVHRLKRIIMWKSCKLVSKYTVST